MEISRVHKWARKLVAAPEDALNKYLFKPYFSWHRKEAARRAMADPEYARIETLRHTNPRTGKPLVGSVRFTDDELDWEHWEYQQQIEEKVLPRNWPYKLKWWIDAHGPDAQYRALVRFVQRGRRGWSDQDVWNLYSWLSRSIPSALRELARINCSWPGEQSSWPKPEDWEAALRDLADRLEKLSDEDWHYDRSVSEVDRQAFIAETFQMFGKMYLHLWD